MSNSSEGPALMSEIALLLGVSRATAWYRARAGEIPGVEWRAGRYEMSRADFSRLAKTTKPRKKRGLSRTNVARKALKDREEADAEDLRLRYRMLLELAEKLGRCCLAPPPPKK